MVLTWLFLEQVGVAFWNGMENKYCKAVLQGCSRIEHNMLCGTKWMKQGAVKGSGKASRMRNH